MYDVCACACQHACTYIYIIYCAGVHADKSGVCGCRRVCCVQEGVLIGCGSKLTQLRFASRLAMPEFEGSSHLAKRPPIFVSPLFQTKFGSLQSLQERQAPSLADTQQAR
jgi:hypothetical protein